MRLTKTTKLVLGSNKSVLNRAIQCRNFATPAAPATENRHSYLKNNEQKFEPIKNTVGYVMSKNARAQPYSNALRSTHQDIQLSQATLKKHIEALACGYLELGLRIGDRVGIIQGATAEQYIVQIACAKIGAIAVQFQGINNAKDLARYLDLFRPRFLVLPTKVGKTDYLKIVQEAFPEMNSVNPRLQTTIPFKSNRFTFLKYVFFTDADEAPLPGTSLLQEALLYGPFGYYDGPLRRVAFKLNSDTPAAIVLEGGIDKGKNVVLTQGNILNAASAIANTLGLQQGDVVFVPSYQQSTFGIVANYTAFVSGATVVFPSRDFNASEVLRQLNAEKCTALFIRRTEVDALLAQQSDSKYDTVKYIVTDQVTQDDISNLQKKFTNAKVVVIGGLEEANALLSIDGKLLPGIEAKVTRDGDDRIVHKDTFGDLRIRGHTVSTKVWNDIGLMNADVDEEGWVRTGRLGKIDANNQLSMQ